MGGVEAIGVIASKFEVLAPVLNERSRRVWAATEARSLGHGGIIAVSRATGISESTIRRGLKELDSDQSAEPGRIRGPGGGRKRAEEKDPTLLADLEGMVEPTASGHPLRWTSKSVRKLAAELRAMGHLVSYQLVSELLHRAGYRLQANRKTREGTNHPDRDAQFRFINDQVRRASRCFFSRGGRPPPGRRTRTRSMSWADGLAALPGSSCLRPRATVPGSIPSNPAIRASPPQPHLRDSRPAYISGAGVRRASWRTAR